MVSGVLDELQLGHLCTVPRLVIFENTIPQLRQTCKSSMLTIVTVNSFLLKNSSLKQVKFTQ